MKTVIENRSGPPFDVRKDVGHLGRTGADATLAVVLPLVLLWASIVGWNVGNPASSGFWLSLWPLVLLGFLGAGACVAGVTLAAQTHIYDMLPKPVRAVGWTMVVVSLTMMVTCRLIDGATQQIRLRMDAVGGLLADQIKASLADKEAKLSLLEQQLRQADARIEEAKAAGKPTEALMKERDQQATQIAALQGQIAGLQKVLDELANKMKEVANAQAANPSQAADGPSDPPGLNNPPDGPPAGGVAGTPGSPGTLANPGMPYEPGQLPMDPSTKGSDGQQAMMAMAGLMLAIAFPELIPVLAPLFAGLALGTDVRDLPPVKETAEHWERSGQNINVPDEVARLREHCWSNPKAAIENLLTVLNQPHWKEKLGPQKVAQLQRELEIQKAAWTDLPQITNVLGMDAVEQLMRDLPPHLANANPDGLRGFVQNNCPPNVHPTTWVAVIDNFIDQSASGKGWSLAGGNLQRFVLTPAAAAELKKVAREKPEAKKPEDKAEEADVKEG
jgi:hypothetical protein